MSTTKTRILNKSQIEQKINRIAYQIFEDNFEERTIIIGGIAKNGYVVAKKIAATLSSISPIKVKLLEIVLDKTNPMAKAIQLSLPEKQFKNKVVILVDDVLNSGRTLIYALRPFLQIPVKKIRTVALIDRSHKRFPVAVDYAGLSLATTLKEHVSVTLSEKEEAAYLI